MPVPRNSVYHIREDVGRMKKTKGSGPGQYRVDGNPEGQKTRKDRKPGKKHESVKKIGKESTGRKVRDGGVL